MPDAKDALQHLSPTTDIARHLAQASTDCPARLTQFHALLNDYAPAQLPAVETAWHLSRLLTGDNTPYQAEALKSALQWLQENAEDALKQQLMQALLKRVPILDTHTQADWLPVLQLLLQLIQQSRDTASQAALCRVLLLLLDQWLTQQTDVLPIQILQAQQHLLSGTGGDLLAQQMLQNHHFLYMTVRVSSSRYSSAAIVYLTGVFQALGIGNQRWEQYLSDDTWIAWINSCLVSLAKQPDALPVLLSAVANGPPMLFCLLLETLLSRSLSEYFSSKLVSSGFNHIMHEQTDNWQQQVRMCLLKKGQGELLLQEFLQHLNAADPPEPFFWQYYAVVFDTQPAFARQHLNTAVKHYLSRLNAEKLPSEALKLVGCATYLTDHSLLKQLVQISEQQLLGMNADESQLHDLIALKTRHALHTYPDISTLALLVQDVRQQRVASETILQHLEKTSLRGLTDEQYRYCLNYLLPALLTPDDESPAHARLLQCLQTDRTEQKEILIKHYMMLIHHLLKQNKYPQTLLTALLCLYLRPFPGIEALKIRLKTPLILLLGRQPHWQLRRLKVTSCANRHLDIKTLQVLQSLMREVNANRLNFWQHCRRWLLKRFR